MHLTALFQPLGHYLLGLRVFKRVQGGCQQRNSALRSAAFSLVSGGRETVELAHYYSSDGLHHYYSQFFLHVQLLVQQIVLLQFLYKLIKSSTHDPELEKLLLPCLSHFLVDSVIFNLSE